MAMVENLAVNRGASGPSTRAASKGGLHDQDKRDFGAELSALLTTVVPSPSVKHLEATSSATPTHPGKPATETATVQVTASQSVSAELPAMDQGGFPRAASATPSTATEVAISLAPLPIVTTLNQADRPLARAETNPARGEVVSAKRLDTPVGRPAKVAPVAQAYAGRNARTAIAATLQPEPLAGADNSHLVQAKAADAGPHAKPIMTTHELLRGTSLEGPHSVTRTATGTAPISAPAPTSSTVVSPIAAPVIPHHSQSQLNSGSPPLAAARPDLSRSAPPIAATRLRPTGEVQSAPEPARTAALKIDLADGAAARASVRERAGNIEVHIVTNNSPVAQHLTDQLGGLRRALDATGLRLARADVSYRGEGGARHERDAPDQGDAGARTSRRDQGDGQVFAAHEAEQ